MATILHSTVINVLFLLSLLLMPKSITTGLLVLVSLSFFIISLLFLSKVAGVLIDLLIKNAMVNTALFNAVKPEKVPALVHGYSSYEGRRFGILKIHPAVSRLYKSYLTNQGDIAMETEKMPMLVPPRPWTSINEGGYLVHPGIAYCLTSENIDSTFH